MSPDPEAGAARSSSTKWYTIGAASVVVVLGLIAVAATGMVSVVSNEQQVEVEQVAYSNVAPPDPLFEPASAEGDDPFFPLSTQLVAFTAQTGQDLPGASEIATGLYGGTVSETCDPARLIDFLMTNTEQGEAWAAVQGIDFSEIPAYIESLDARVLAAPAVVLNHGFDEETGTAYQVESEFDAGTAVLVDAGGDIRARCYCGNPVKPKPVGHRPPRCLAFGALVHATPGSSNPEERDAREVVLVDRVVAVATDRAGRRQCLEDRIAQSMVHTNET